MDDDALDRLLTDAAKPRDEDRDVPLETLRAYRDGQLDAEAAAQVEAALAADGALRATLAGLSERPPQPVYDWANANWPGGVDRRWVLGVVGVGAAAAAALLVYLGRPDPGPEFVLEGPFGGRAAARDAPSQGQVFDARSQVKIVLRAPAASAGPAHVAVFQVREGVLHQRDVTIEGDANGFRLTGSGAAFFGDAPGRVEVAVGVSATPLALDGQPLADAPGVRWHRFTVEYAP